MRQFIKFNISVLHAKTAVQCLLPVLLWITATWLGAVEITQSEKAPPLLLPDKLTESIRIDGELDEAVWQKTPIKQPFKTFSPSRGLPLHQETLVWAAYDRETLYFAFQCLDTSPGRIKTSIARRDNITHDDQVGILLDASGSKQTNYEFYINPNGVQGDAVNSAIRVNGADFAPDFVWKSAGKITPTGYQVEVAIPLESIRYQGKENVRMGVIFTRQITHLGIKGAWPELPAGQTVFNAMATLLYKDLKGGGLNMEILPNVTYSHNQDRQSLEQWDTDTDGNIGVGVKYGITSSIVAEATVNPDFSQVESDAFQIGVNRRYPIYFSEKRPFFMESAEVLDFSVVKWGMMAAPIHTRRIVDPGWAVKLSGSAGRLNFAVLGADDRSAGRPWSDGVNPHQGKKALFGIFRAKYNIGGDNSVGVLYSGRYFAGTGNTAAGADLNYRLSPHLRSSISYIRSVTDDGGDTPTRQGGAFNAMLQYETPNLFAMVGHERYDTGFSMDVSFLNRTGFSRWLTGLGPTFNIKIDRMPWLKQVQPYVFYGALHDLTSRLDDRALLFGATLSLAPSGLVNIEYLVEDESWAGHVFRKASAQVVGEIQLFKWLSFRGSWLGGDAIYYDPDEPFVGKSDTATLAIECQPGVKLKLGIDYLHTNLRRPGNNKKIYNKIYNINIFNFNATYQFNRNFFLRGILRYDSHEEKVLTDVLASFTFIPGTVAHLGYGSLYLRNQWQGAGWVPGSDRWWEMKRGLFFKASYLWRF